MKHDPHEKVDRERLRALVLAYGANPTRWPEGERRAAEELLAKAPDSAAWLFEQSRLDAWLDGDPAVEPSPSLLRRVREIPARQGSWHGVRAFWPLGRLRNFFTVIAAAAVMGAAVGAAIPERTEVADDDASWEDLSTLALGVDLAEEAP